MLERNPRPNWDDLSPSEQMDLKLSPLSVGLLVILAYLLFGLGPA